MGYRETLIAHCLLFRNPGYPPFLVRQNFGMGALTNGISPRRVDVDCELWIVNWAIIDREGKCCVGFPWRKHSLYLGRALVIGALVKYCTVHTPVFPANGTQTRTDLPSAHHQNFGTVLQMCFRAYRLLANVSSTHCPFFRVIRHIRRCRIPSKPRLHVSLAERSTKQLADK